MIRKAGIRLSRICCFTGHREIKDKYILQLPEMLDKLLDRLIAKDVYTFRAGGARGFDTLCALKVLEKKKTNPKIRLELCLPCHDQTQNWGNHDNAVYEFILSQADAVSYAEKNYVKGCMFKRNRMLVDGSDICVGFCSSETGGTAYTLSYAKEKGVPTINLFDKFTTD